MTEDDLPKLALKTLLLPLIQMLLPAAANDRDLAWNEAMAAINVFNPRTTAEFWLGIRIAVFNIHASQALAQAATPDLPMNVVLRARQCAISLVREPDKAERRLEKLQHARRKENKPDGAYRPRPQPERALQPAPLAAIPQAPAPQTKEALPVWKQRKQEHRLVKQQARDARLQAQAITQPRQTENRQPDGIPSMLPA